MSARKTAVILGHALVGWVLCAATIGIGMRLFSLLTALLLHNTGLTCGHFPRRRGLTGLPPCCAGPPTKSFDLCKPSWHSDPFRADFISAYIMGRWWEAVTTADHA